jgi:hypothetical protein
MVRIGREKLITVLVGLGAAGASAAGGWWIDLAPPGDPGKLFAPALTGFSFFILFAVFKAIQAVLAKKWAAETSRKFLWIGVAIVASIVSIMNFFDYYTEYQTSILTLNTGERVVIGGVDNLTPYAREWLKEQPGRMVKDLMPNIKNDPEAIWSSESIAVAEKTLLWKYFLMFLASGFAIAGAVEANRSGGGEEGEG